MAASDGYHKCPRCGSLGRYYEHTRYCDALKPNLSHRSVCVLNLNLSVYDLRDLVTNL